MLGEEADSPRGRIQLIADFVTGEHARDSTALGLASSAAAQLAKRLPDPAVVGHLEMCLVCRACETACPSGVPFGRIMEAAREDLRDREPSGLGRTFRRAALEALTHPAWLTLVRRLTSVAEALGILSIARRCGGRVGWIASLAPRPEGAAFALVDRADADVAVFAGCVMREAFGETERATVRLLEQDGHRVSAPVEQTCCGALHVHAGEGERARELARYNIDAFSGSDGKIVVNAAGCGAHLKAYGELLSRDPFWSERATQFASRVRDVSEVVQPRKRRAGRAMRVVYQDACHLAHGQRIRTQPRALLRSIEGLTLVEIADPERCCGSAGIYNLTHPDVARELQRQKVQTILDAAADVVVSANPGCIMQLAAGLRAAGSSVRVTHLARFLDEIAAGEP